MTPRESLIEKVKHLSDKQIDVFLQLMEMIDQPSDGDGEYREEDDPTIGFLSTDPDFASTSSEVLRRELKGGE